MSCISRCGWDVDVDGGGGDAGGDADLEEGVGGGVAHRAVELVEDVAVEDERGRVGGDGSGVGEGDVDVLVLGPDVDSGGGVADAGHEQVELTVDRGGGVVEEGHGLSLDVHDVAGGVLDHCESVQNDWRQSGS